MLKANYPALYRSADTASLRAQNTHFLLLKGNGAALVAAAMAGLFGANSAAYSWVSAILFIAATAISGLMVTKRYDIAWYKTRALAESVKTTTWRYVMGVEPFSKNCTMQHANSEFVKRLKEIIEDNKQIAGDLIDAADSDQITDAMKAIREAEISARKNYYRNERVSEQQKWYAAKATQNNKLAQFFFLALIGFQIAAMGSAIGRAIYPNWMYWPTDILALLASLILGWTQAKRFSELSASYALAAHEIGLIKEKIGGLNGEEELSDFVAEAEGAFSREHTQWVAQRD